MDTMQKQDETDEEPAGFDEHRREMIKISRRVNALIGITGKPTMTVEQLQASQLARGADLHDNPSVRELMKMRYGDDWDKE